MGYLSYGHCLRFHSLITLLTYLELNCDLFWLLGSDHVWRRTLGQLNVTYFGFGFRSPLAVDPWVSMPLVKVSLQWRGNCNRVGLQLGADSDFFTHHDMRVPTLFSCINSTFVSFYLLGMHTIRLGSNSQEFQRRTASHDSKKVQPIVSRPKILWPDPFRLHFSYAIG